MLDRTSSCWQSCRSSQFSCWQHLNVCYRMPHWKFRLLNVWANLKLLAWILEFDFLENDWFLKFCQSVLAKPHAPIWLNLALFRLTPSHSLPLLYSFFPDLIKSFKKLKIRFFFGLTIFLCFCCCDLCVSETVKKVENCWHC